MKWIYAVDFDGVIVQNAYPQIGHLSKLAFWGMRKLKAQGHTITIWTCRTEAKLYELEIYCWSLGIPADYINETSPEILAAFGGVDNRKIFANRYLDDRNFLWTPLLWPLIVLEGWIASKTKGWTGAGRRK